MPYESIDGSIAETDAPRCVETAVPPIESEHAAVSPDAGLLAPYRGEPRALRHARRDFEQAARTIPRTLLRGALADQLMHDGARAFAVRIARIFVRAAPWLRNDIVAELLIGCGPCANAHWPSDGDCNVEALAELAFERRGGTTHQIADLCCRFPALAVALDHVDLADVLARLARAPPAP